MAWTDSLTQADLAELRALGDRPDELEDFFKYVVLAITVRALGPIPIAEMSATDHRIWKGVYADQFDLRSDGRVHLKRALAVVS